MVARRRKLLVSVRSDAGKERPRNEDNYCYLERQGITLLAVADGMGGHAGGDVASSLAMETLNKFFFSTDRDEFTDENILSLLECLVKTTNQAIYNAALQNPEIMGMGTTLTMGLTFNNKLFWGHVGDSRVYVIKDGYLKRLTYDHSLVQEMLNQGKITPEEARNHPQKNILTRVLGTHSQVEVDLGEWELQAGDDLLFCTDGLTSLLEEDDILKITRAHRDDPEKAATLMVDIANSRGGSDNITLIYVVEAGRKNTS